MDHLKVIEDDDRNGRDTTFMRTLLDTTIYGAHLKSTAKYTSDGFIEAFERVLQMDWPVDARPQENAMNAPHPVPLARVAGTKRSNTSEGDVPLNDGSSTSKRQKKK
jgi:hypothetical protein